MTTPAPNAAGRSRRTAAPPTKDSGSFLTRIPLHVVIIALCALWFTPNFALLVSSFRPASEIATTGWWTAFSPPLKFTFDLYRQALATSNMGEALLTASTSPSPAP